MFVALSMSVSIVILCLLYYYSKQRSQSQERNYQQIISLRLIMELCRQHRALTHQAMVSDDFSKPDEVLHVEQQLQKQTSDLINLASFDHKSLFRILQMKTAALGQDWQQRSFARNQRTHGTAIRHCMFLIDDIALAWLVESGREDLSDEYHLNWQQVLDSMEILTQLRICIQEKGHRNEELRIKYYADKIRHKLQQLSLISPLTIQSPLGLQTQAKIDLLISSQNLKFTTQQLYALTTDISQLIAQVYDDMLSDITESLYQPLPAVGVMPCENSFHMG